MRERYEILLIGTAVSILLIVCGTLLITGLLGLLEDFLGLLVPLSLLAIMLLYIYGRYLYYIYYKEYTDGSSEGPATSTDST